jgi:hypothetical protein
MRCHPALPLRRWGDAKVETTCERFRAAEPVELPPQPESESAREIAAGVPEPAGPKPKPRVKRKG